MKLVTYSVEAPFGPVDRLGTLEGEEVLDLNAAYTAKLADDEIDSEALAALLVPSSMPEPAGVSDN